MKCQPIVNNIKNCRLLFLPKANWGYYCKHSKFNHVRTQCKDEFRNLSRCVTEILTASRIDINFFLDTIRKLLSIAFQPCISWGGTYGRNGSNKWFRPNFIPKNTNFSGHFSWSPDFGGGWDPQFWKYRHFSHVPWKPWGISFQMSYWEGRWRQYCPIGGHLKIFSVRSCKNAKKSLFS